MNTIRNYIITAFTVAFVLCAAMLSALRAPVDWLDAKVAEKGEDPEAGLTTMEYVVISAIVLAVVVTVGALITGRMEGWAEKIPQP